MAKHPHYGTSNRLNAITHTVADLPPAIMNILLR